MSRLNVRGRTLGVRGAAALVPITLLVLVMSGCGTGAEGATQSAAEATSRPAAPTIPGRSTASADPSYDVTREECADPTVQSRIAEAKAAPVEGPANSAPALPEDVENSGAGAASVERQRALWRTFSAEDRTYYLCLLNDY